MGENQNQPFQLSFNPVLKVDFQGSRVTSDGGVILVRELDERLGLGDLIAEHLGDLRRGKNTQLQERGISVASTSSAHCAKRAHARLRAFSTSTACEGISSAFPCRGSRHPERTAQAGLDHCGCISSRNAVVVAGNEAAAARCLHARARGSRRTSTRR